MYTTKHQNTCLAVLRWQIVKLVGFLGKAFKEKMCGKFGYKKKEKKKDLGSFSMITMNIMP